MMLHVFELAATSWLAFYAKRVFGGDIYFQLAAWAVFFAMIYLIDRVTAE